MPASSRHERVYLVRVWTEPSVVPRPNVRGTVMDVQSGSLRCFTRLGDILDFVEAGTFAGSAASTNKEKI